MTTPSTGARAAAKTATRDALIDAAMAEFVEHGPNTPSLDAICERAGYTRGAFYVHFKDREELLVAVMDRVLGDLLRTVAGQPDGFAGGVRKFTAAAVARSPSVHPDGGLRFQHVLEACRASRAIGDRYRMLLQAGTAWAKHALGVTDDATAQVIIASALGMVVLLELDVPIDPLQFGEALIKLAPKRRRARRA
jgi:TetR/AcrR family transcriptional regulator, transcriptional repressor for nem operon